MDETIEKCLKECEEIEQYKQDTLRAAQNDSYHKDNPQRQLDTLCVLANDLLINNESGKNDELIGFYHHVGKSLKKLIKLQEKLDALWKI